MSKTKKKTHNELEHFQGEIRRLNAENRKLKKRNRELEKWEHVFTSEEEPEVVLEKVEKCPKCDQGQLAMFDFKHAQFMICNLCEYKENTKNGKKEIPAQRSKGSSNTKASADKSLLVRKKKGKGRS